MPEYKRLDKNSVINYSWPTKAINLTSQLLQQKCSSEIHYGYAANFSPMKNQQTRDSRTS